MTEAATSSALDEETTNQQAPPEAASAEQGSCAAHGERQPGAIELSIRDYLADRYRGTRVRMAGYLFLNFERNKLIEPVERKSAVALGIHGVPFENASVLEPCQGKLVTVEGYVTMMPAPPGRLRPYLKGYAIEPGATALQP